MSSKKTAKISGVPNVPLTNYEQPYKKLNEIFGDGVTGGSSPDPYDKYEREEAEEAVKELNDLRAQRKKLEFKKKLEEKKKELTNLERTTLTGQPAMPAGIDLEMLKYLNTLPEEDRINNLEVIKQIQLYQGFGQGGSGGNSGMSALLLMQLMNQKKEDYNMIDMFNMWNTIYKGAGQGDKDLTNTMLINLLNANSSLQGKIIENQQQNFMSQINRLEQQQGDPLSTIKGVKEVAKELGLMPSNVSNEVALKGLEMQNQWKLKEWELEQQKFEQSKTVNLFKEILSQVNIPEMVNMFARRETNNLLRGASGRQPQPPPPPQNQPQQPAQYQQQTQPPPSGGVAMFICQKCGGEIWSSPNQTMVTCPSCGTVYTPQRG